MAGIKNWKGKKYKDQRTGKECPMISPWSYRFSPGKAGVRFTSKAQEHAFAVLKKTNNLSEAAESVGVSFPAFRRWLIKAGIDHEKYKYPKGKGRRSGGTTKAAPKKKSKKTKGGRAVSMSKKKQGKRYDHEAIFMACYMHQHGFSNNDIRKRVGKVSDTTFARWFDDFNIVMDLDSIDQQDRIAIMLELSNGTDQKKLSKEFDINLGIVEQIKKEMETQIGTL